MNYKNTQQYLPIYTSTYNDLNFKKSPNKQPFFQSVPSYTIEQNITKPQSNWLNSQNYHRLKKIPDIYSNLRQTINSYSSSQNQPLTSNTYQSYNNDLFKSSHNKSKKDDYLRNTINYSKQAMYPNNAFLSHSSVGLGGINFKNISSTSTTVSLSSNNIEPEQKWKKRISQQQPKYLNFAKSKIQIPKKEYFFERTYDKPERKDYKSPINYQKVADKLKNNTQMLYQLKRLQQQRKNRIQGRLIAEKFQYQKSPPSSFKKLDTEQIKKKYLKSQYQNRDCHTPKIQNHKKLEKYNSLNYSAKQQDYKSRKSKSPILNQFKTQKQNCTQINGFILIKSLGQGKFGTVYRAIHLLTGSIYAIKKVPKSMIKDHLMIDQFLLEIKLQSFFNNPNIVKIYGVFDDKESIYLILEYMQEGTLFAYLKKNKTIPQQEAALKIKDVAFAIQDMHQCGVAHRDIKPQNIVMTNGVCKLCDYGWATICDQRRKTYCGTFDYAAPQILQGVEYDMTVDLWCLGVLAYQLMVGKAPFYHLSRKQTMKKIINVDTTSINYPSNLSKHAVSFITQLLKKIPQQRLKSSDILAHEFLKSVPNQTFM